LRCEGQVSAERWFSKTATSKPSSSRFIRPRGNPAEGGEGQQKSCVQYQRGYTTTSIKRGPRFFIALASCRANSSTDVERLASTPMPEASLTQSSSGLCRSSIEKALGPGSPAPTRASSILRIAYERLAKIKVVTSSASRACV